MLLTPGAVTALFLVHTTLLEAGSHVVVTRPNYATNVETPRAIGADVSFLDLAYEDGWAVDPDRIAALLRPETRLVSLTTPHNPTGTTLDRTTLDAVIALVERHGTARLLVDETYREMTFGEPLPVAATLSDRVISVTSLSKTYGLPGIRVGWLVARDRALAEQLLAAKEQVLISGSLVDETIALAALRRRPTWLPAIRARIGEAFEITAAWIEATRASSGYRRAVASWASRASGLRWRRVSTRTASTRAVRPPRHRRRARALVRAAAGPLPARLRLAIDGRAPRRARGPRLRVRRGRQPGDALARRTATRTR